MVGGEKYSHTHVYVYVTFGGYDAWCSISTEIMPWSGHCNANTQAIPHNNLAHGKSQNDFTLVCFHFGTSINVFEILKLQHTIRGIFPRIYFFGNA